MLDSQPSRPNPNLPNLMGVMRKHDLSNNKKRQRQIQRQRQWQIHLENTFKERSMRLLTFETFHQSDEKTLSGQQKDNDKDKDNDKYIQLREHLQSAIFGTCDLWDICWGLRVMRKYDLSNKKTMTKTKTNTMTITIWEHLQRRLRSPSNGNPRELVKLLTSKHYNHLIVTWQWRVTLDSISNSC